jgi:hypothetical protein
MDDPKTYGGKTAEELTALHEAATPEPWQEFAESGDWWMGRADSDGGPADDRSICATGSEDWTEQADIDLTVAARNALPDLLAEVERLRVIEADYNRIAAFMRARGWLAEVENG